MGKSSPISLPSFRIPENRRIGTICLKCTVRRAQRAYRQKNDDPPLGILYPLGHSVLLYVDEMVMRSMNSSDTFPKTLI